MKLQKALNKTFWVLVRKNGEVDTEVFYSDLPSLWSTKKDSRDYRSRAPWLKAVPVRLVLKDKRKALR